MRTSEPARPALLRGSSVGLLTATLAVAAHGAAGGGVPTPRGVLVVVAAAAVLGAACTLVPGLRRGTAPLAAVLAASQYLAHGALELAAGGGHVLTAADHAGHAGMAAMPGDVTAGGVVPGSTGGMAPMSTSPAMLLGHALAVVGCVLLVRRAERVSAAVLAVVRRVLPVAGLLLTAPEPPERPGHRLVPPAPRPGARLVVVSAVPQRGPPAGALSSC